MKTAPASIIVCLITSISPKTDCAIRQPLPLHGHITAVYRSSPRSRLRALPIRSISAHVLLPSGPRTVRAAAASGSSRSRLNPLAECRACISTPRFVALSVRELTSCETPGHAARRVGFAGARRARDDAVCISGGDAVIENPLFFGTGVFL